MGRGRYRRVYSIRSKSTVDPVALTRRLWVDFDVPSGGQRQEKGKKKRNDCPSGGFVIQWPVEELTRRRSGPTRAAHIFQVR